MFSFVGAIRIDSFGNRVAMDAQRGGGVRDALLVARECFLNVELFEFLKSFVEHDVAVEHVVDYSFQSGAYLHQSLVPIKISIDMIRVRIEGKLPFNWTP